MAQMPIQLLSGRAEVYSAASPAAFTAQPKVAIPRTAYLYDTSGISGGLLRPGATDQAQFKTLLAAAEKQAMVAPPATGKAPMMSGIPSLSPAQLAALGAVEEPAAGELIINIPAPNPVDPGQATPKPRQALPGQPGGIEGGTGKTATPLFPANPGSTAPASAAPAGDPAPESTDAAPDSALPGDPSAAPAMPPSTAPAPQPHVERGTIPGSHRGADGVWELTRLPDKDERDMLRGQKWRVVESQASRELFLGPDGEFGWDDFLDIINPLQHIPLVNIAYRAITGDEIYGAARLMDAALGPLAGVSTAVDLAFRSTTGKSMAENGIAAVFGTGDEADGVPSVNTASGSVEQQADAGLIRRGSHK